MKRTFKKRAMAMGMAAVMSVGSAAAMDTTSIQAAVKNLDKASATKSLVVGVGYKKQISVKNVPKSTTVTYTAKNKKIVSVDKKGKVKGKKAGSTYVTLKLKYKKKTVTKKCKVTVKTAVKSVKVAKKTVSLKVGGTYQTKVTVAPAKAYKKVTYTSSNKGIATVSEKGLVKAKKAGSTKITVKAQDGSGKSVKFTVNVKKATVKPTATPKATEPVNTPSVTESAKPTVAPTETPSVTADTKPTAVPATEVPATTAPTTAPTATPAEVTKTITGADVKDGKVVVTGEYDNLVIEASVGNAEVTLDKTVVRKNVTLNGNADYTVIANDAQLANVEVVENKPVVKAGLQYISRFITFELDKRPTLHIKGKTVVTNVNIAADVHLTGENTGKVQNVTIKKESKVAIAAPVTALKLEQGAQNASVEVSSEVTTVDIVAPKAVISIAGTGKVNHVAVAIKAEGAVLNVSGQVNNIKAEAKTTTVKVEKEAKVEAIQVVKEAEGTKVELAGTVTNVVAEAKTMTVKVEKEAKVEAIQVTKEAEGTKVELAGTVTNVVAEAKTMTVKVEKEAKVEVIKVEKEAEGTKLELSGTVTSVTTAADKTEVKITEEAKVNNLETSGNSTSIQGSGTVEKVEIKGNDTVVEGIGADKLVVDKDASGTTVNDKEVSGGTETDVKPIPKPGEGENTGGNTGDNNGGSTGDNTGGNTSGGGSSGGSSSGGGSGSTGGNTSGGSGSTTEKTELEKAKEALTAKISESKNYLTEVKSGYAATGSAVTGLGTEIENAKALVSSTTVTDAAIVVKQTSDLTSAVANVKGCIDKIDSGALAPQSSAEFSVDIENNVFTVYTANSTSGSALNTFITTRLDNYSVEIDKDDSVVIFTKTIDGNVVFKGTWSVVRYEEVADSDKGEFSVKESLSDNISAIHVVQSGEEYVIVAVGKNGAVLSPADITNSHYKENTRASWNYIDDQYLTKKWIQVANTVDHTYKNYDYVIETDTIAPLVSGDRKVSDKTYAVSVVGKDVTIGLPDGVDKLPQDSSTLNTILDIKNDTDTNVSYVTTATDGAITITKNAYGKEIAKDTSYKFTTSKVGTQAVDTFNFSVGTAKDIYAAEVEDSKVAIYTKKGVTSCEGIVVSNSAISGTINVLKYNADSISISYKENDVDYIQNLPITWVEVPSADQLTVSLSSNGSNSFASDIDDVNKKITLEAKTKDASVTESSFEGKIKDEATGEGKTDTDHIVLTYKNGELTIAYQTKGKNPISGVSKTYMMEVKKLSDLGASQFTFSKNENSSDVLAVEKESDKVVIYGSDENDFTKDDVKVSVASGSSLTGTVTLDNSSESKKIKVTYGSGVETYVKTFTYEYVTVPSVDELTVGLSDEGKSNFTSSIAGKEITLEAKKTGVNVATGSFIAGTMGDNDTITTTDTHIKFAYNDKKVIVTYETTDGTVLRTKEYNVNVKLFSDLTADKFTFTAQGTNILAMETQSGSSDGNDKLVVYRKNVNDITDSDIQKVEVASEGAVNMSVTVSGNVVKVAYGTADGKDSYVKTFKLEYVEVPSEDDLNVELASNNGTFSSLNISGTVITLVAKSGVTDIKVENATFTGKNGSSTENIQVGYDATNKQVTVSYVTSGGKKAIVSKTYDVKVVQESPLTVDKFTFEKNGTNDKIKAVVRDSDKVLVYRTDSTEKVTEGDIQVQVASGSTTPINGIPTVSSDKGTETVKVTYKSADGSETYVKDFTVSYVEVPAESDLELKLKSGVTDIEVLQNSEAQVLLTELTADEIAARFEVTSGGAIADLSNFTVVSKSAVGADCNITTIKVGLDVKGTTNTDPEKALVKFTKHHFTTLSMITK